MPPAAEPTGAGAERFRRAVAGIDAANADDPVTIDADGVARPKELAHADAVERWLRRLDPHPTEEQVLAARAHHLRRWVVARDAYPDGRSGYLRWRTDQKRRQADEVRTILAGSGYDEAAIDRVATIVAKRGLGTDPQVQTHEDALCLTFLELQLDDLAARLGPAHTVQVIRKTAAKMSAAALAAAADVPLSASGAALLAEAMAPAAEVDPADD